MSLLVRCLLLQNISCKKGKVKSLSLLVVFLLKICKNLSYANKV